MTGRWWHGLFTFRGATSREAELWLGILAFAACLLLWWAVAVSGWVKSAHTYCGLEITIMQTRPSRS